jgi:hypothetical protein
VLQRAEFGKLDVKDPIPRLDLTGTPAAAFVTKRWLR